MRNRDTAQGSLGSYTYYAFIRYKRADAKWAFWLKRQLQRYRLPNRTRKIHPNLVDYSEEGFVREVRYVSNPVYNEIATDADGVAGLRYERDAQGRATRISYLSYMGSSNSARDSEHYEVIGIRSGVCHRDYAYDADFNVSALRYVGNDGLLTPGSEGYAEARYSHAHHNCVEKTFSGCQRRNRALCQWVCRRKNGLRRIRQQDEGQLLRDGRRAGAKQRGGCGLAQRIRRTGPSGKVNCLWDRWQSDNDQRWIRWGCFFLRCLRQSYRDHLAGLRRQRTVMGRNCKEGNAFNLARKILKEIPHSIQSPRNMVK